MSREDRKRAAEERRRVVAEQLAVKEAKAAEERQAKLIERKGYRPDLAAAVVAAEAEGLSFIGVGGALKDIGDHLYDGEVVEMVVPAEYASGYGICVLTDSRIIDYRSEIGAKKLDAVRRVDIALGESHCSGVG